MNPLEKLKAQLAASLQAIGIDPSGIFVTERGIALPFAEMQVSLKTINGERVWQCVERYSARGLGTDEEKPRMITRFEEPMDQPLRIARSIALHVAAVRVDAALDDVA